jgi:hypothetical protein
MSSKSKKVSYLNKKGERVTYSLSTALKSDNKELIKRLNYARQVLEFTMKQDNEGKLKNDIDGEAFGRNTQGLNTDRGRTAQQLKNHREEQEDERYMMASAR